MNWLLNFLRNYLLPGVDDDGLELDPPADPDEPADPVDPDEPADPADPDAPTDPDAADPDQVDDDPPAPRETRAQKAIRELREQRQESERQLAVARAELEVARRPQQQPAQPDPEQVIWQQEEETLRNPDATDWQKYAIAANRSARQAQAQVRAVQQQTWDLQDRTSFQALAATNPKVYAHYKDRVEEEVQKARAKGQFPPREVVLQVLLGKDMLAGKVRAAEKKKPTTGAAPRRAPASDVPASGRGRLSESDARAKRLENIRI